MARVEPKDIIFALSLASDDTTISPPTVRSLLTVVSPLAITLKASDRLEKVPFPITKTVFAGFAAVALPVTVEPLKLLYPITNKRFRFLLVTKTNSIGEPILVVVFLVACLLWVFL